MYKQDCMWKEFLILKILRGWSSIPLPHFVQSVNISKRAVCFQSTHGSGCLVSDPVPSKRSASSRSWLGSNISHIPLWKYCFAESFQQWVLLFQGSSPTCFCGWKWHWKQNRDVTGFVLRVYIFFFKHMVLDYWGAEDIYETIFGSM